MQKQLYPIDQVEDSLERHLVTHAGRGRGIYTVTVLLMLAALAALPLVRVGVSVQSDGIVRPTTEKHEVRAGAAGFAEGTRVREGQQVRRGDVLLTLRAAPLDERLQLAASQATDVRGFLADLELLTAQGGRAALSLDRFRSARYRQEYVELASRLRDNELRERKAAQELQRATALNERGLTAQSEVEDRAYAVSQARSERAELIERAQSGWQASLATARRELKDLESQRQQLQAERELYRVVAPVDGTVEELLAVSTGSFVQAGQALGVISPSSELVAEVYVTPRDIGLVRVGTPARVQVDAFNYNDWGFLSGRVDEVSDDFVQVNDQPVFRVRVALDETELSLKNGFRGRLKKGMTLRARFMVADRSLLQLVRDDVNDWLNPVQAGR